jgi:cation diffusion facilitator CzcD-associated flavoprotein CzcO
MLILLILGTKLTAEHGSRTNTWVVLATSLHLYTYSFQPHTEGSGFYSGSDEIEKYFEKFHDQHKLVEYIRLNTEVLSATWQEDAGGCKPTNAQMSTTLRNGSRN